MLPEDIFCAGRHRKTDTLYAGSFPGAGQDRFILPGRPAAARTRRSTMAFEWTVTEEEAAEADELAVMIPSVTVRRFAAETGFIFSDAARACLLCTSSAPLKIRYYYLTQLGERTEDTALRDQIRSFLKKQKARIAALMQNPDSACVYGVILDADEEYLPAAYFLRLGAALQWAEKNTGNNAFEVIKKPLQDRRTVKRSAGNLSFDARGRLLDFKDTEAEPVQADLTCAGFRKGLDAVPNPFSRGDIVRRWDRNKYGIIEGSRSLSGGAIPAADEHNGCVRVVWVFDEADTASAVGNFYHTYESPVQLESYVPAGGEEDATGADALLLSAQELVRGEGSLEKLQYCTDRLRQRYRGAGK